MDWAGQAISSLFSLPFLSSLSLSARTAHKLEQEEVAD
jgi:hypothetical protein